MKRRNVISYFDVFIVLLKYEQSMAGDKMFC